jgi:hypothetical protein
MLDNLIPHPRTGGFFTAPGIAWRVPLNLWHRCRTPPVQVYRIPAPPAEPMVSSRNSPGLGSRFYVKEIARQFFALSAAIASFLN